MVKDEHIAVYQTNRGYDVFVVEGYKDYKSGKATKIIPANGKVATFEDVTAAIQRYLEAGVTVK